MPFIVNFPKFPLLKVPIIQTLLNINSKNKNNNQKKPAGGARLHQAAAC